MEHQSDVKDPCADFGPIQMRAIVWFFCVILFGGFLTYKLSSIDRWMYDNDGETFDRLAHQENRRALFGISSEHLDPRQNGSYVAAAKKTAAK